MESVRWMRLAPLALAVVAGAVGLGRPAASAAADPPWDPPPCPAGAATGPAVGACYRLDAVLDATGTLAGRRLLVGATGTPERHLDLGPESFASGPVGGLVLTGDDDGSVSRLRLLDPARGCATTVADEAAVIRSAVVSADGGTIYEHRVARGTREDLGVWRRAVASPRSAVPVLAGLEPDPALGPTFATELVAGADGRLVVSSCALEACRVRVFDPASGATRHVERTGPALGVAGSRLVAWDACPGLPCAITAVDLDGGSRTMLASDALAAAIGGADDATLVIEAPDGRVAAVDARTGRRSPWAVTGAPIQRGSLALEGLEVIDGLVPLANGAGDGATSVRAFDPSSGRITNPSEGRR